MPKPSPRGAWIVDASIVLKWFLPVEQEPDGELARATIGRLAMRTTTLAAYEVGNILMRHSGWDAPEIATALALIRRTCGSAIALTPEDELQAAKLAQKHDLTFYDASYAAVAERTHRHLLSADGDLLTPGLAVALRDVAV
jgi:predicted nucleic acid-binding protein